MCVFESVLSKARCPKACGPIAGDFDETWTGVFWMVGCLDWADPDVGPSLLGL